GEITKLQLAHPLTGDWRMRAGTERELVLGTDAINVPALCLDGDKGHACLGPFRKDGETWQAAGRLDAVPVSAIAGWLPEGLEYRGTVGGRFRIDGSKGGLDGHAEFDLAPGAIRQGGDDDSETLLGWESGRAVVDFDGAVARGELNVDLEHDGRITGSGTLDVPGNGPMRIDAGLQANIENLQLVPSLVPELSRVRGRLSANLDVKGPLDNPRVTGTARLADGSARILALGTTWQNVHLVFEGEGREVSAQGRAESGDGHIEVNLEGRSAAGGFIGKATLAGTDFQAINTPEARVNISPKLQMQLQARDIFIDGDVLVPFARIEPRDLGGAVQPSDDEVIVNAEQKAAAEGVRVHVAVTTRLGEDVRVDAFGLTARLEGKLTVTKAPQQVAVGNGRLTVMEGEYKAYGQDLTLARGEIIYAGQPLINPGLDVRAERSIDPDIIAGVALRGPLSQPTVSVYSEPAMPETEALSYLLFGRSVDQITGAQKSEVSNTSLALNLGGQKLLGRFGRKIGVEEVRIDQAGDKENASLILGKYLSPDLYVSYGIGLYEAVNTFQVRYRLSSKWTLEATSGLKSSADFFYTIER
ncbi:MAG: translocation/assembly module TamB domain-containing protein, partial [Proteobacteria bacterium]|nr:translocation/assembly module TamB domain-containing protein [Pseudomonadota bacterium]